MFAPKLVGHSFLLSIPLLICLQACGNDDATIPSLQELTYLETDQTKSKQKALNQPIEYAWDLFFYTNWPAQADQRGVADKQREFGVTDRPVVWQSWKNLKEVFRAAGEKPIVWNVPEPIPSFDKLCPDSKPEHTKSMTHLTSYKQADLNELRDIYGKRVYLQILLGQNTFDYIVKNQLYFVEGQQRYGKHHGDFDFPWNAMEAKAAWRWLEPGRDPVDHYITSTAYYAVTDDDGNFTCWQVGLAGLTGLHISTKANKNWVWATYEHDENPTFTEAKPRYAPDAAVQQANAKMKQAIEHKLGKDSPWAHYFLVGVQTQWCEDTTKPCESIEDGAIHLANTQIESSYGFQGRSSCISCHAMANIGVNDNVDRRYPYIIHPNPGYPPYYLGVPPVFDFEKQAFRFPEPHQSMDYVFSLYSAQRCQHPDCASK